jgi:hypothetical protein
MPERSTNNRETRDLFVRSFVSISVPASATFRQTVTQIANGANRPVAIESLPDELDAIKLPRSRSYSGFLGDYLDRIAENFPNMRWWISERGLNMAIVSPNETLSIFDRLAGALCVKYWKNGRLPKMELKVIARELDAKAHEMGGSFLDTFEPAPRARIKEYNQKHARAAIRTFDQAIAHSIFVRLVRRRLYRARDKFTKAPRVGL